MVNVAVLKTMFCRYACKSLSITEICLYSSVFPNQTHLQKSQLNSNFLQIQYKIQNKNKITANIKISHNKHIRYQCF